MHSLFFLSHIASDELMLSHVPLAQYTIADVDIVHDDNIVEFKDIVVDDDDCSDDRNSQNVLMVMIELIVSIPDVTLMLLC
eukprot:5415131-Amphidinium_carterae.1